MRLRGVRSELLQTFRLNHALAEAGIPIAIDAGQAASFEWLSRYFGGLDWRATRVAKGYRDVVVDHKTPRTRIGSVERPLIFAQRITEHCLEKWTDRIYVMMFMGLMTDERQRSLSRLSDAFGADFHVTATDAGRVWPTKAWDDEYYEILGQSQLTACPNGDFIWTYRFFEAALCGSIPVVEASCSHYDGFRFYSMTDSPSSMSWRADWAEHNYRLACQRLTAPHDDLLRAITG